MTNRFVSNAATFVTGLTEADAYTTLGAAITASSNADTIKVSSTHTETAGAGIAYTFPATVGLKIVSVTFNGSGTGGIAAGAVINVGAASALFQIYSGFAYVYGITFVGGTTTSSSCALNIGDTASPIGFVFDTCTFSVPSTTSSARINIGPANSSGNDDIHIRLIKPIFSMGGVRAILLQCGTIVIDEPSIAAGSPTTIFLTAASAHLNALIRGGDFNANVGATPALVNVAVPAYGIISFVGIKAKTGFALTTGAFAGPGGLTVIAQDVDAGDNHFTYMKADWSGTITASNTKYANASNGTDSFSWLMASSANASFTWPLKSPPIRGWNAATGSGKTATVPVAHNAVGGGTAGVLLNSDAWVETLAKITSGFPQMTWNIGDRVANILTAGADQDTDGTTSWTGSSIGTHDKLVTTSFTPAEVGPISGIVNLAKPSVTIYASPNMAVA